MATTTDYNSSYPSPVFLIQQTDSQEAISEYLAKAKALTRVALNKNFLDYDEATIKDYLWALNDLIDKASTISDQNLDLLMKNMRGNICNGY